MFELIRPDRGAGVAVGPAARARPAHRGPLSAAAEQLTRFADVPRASDGETGPTITAVLAEGPLEGRRVEVSVVEGRPPKTLDLGADDGSTCRYGLADWTQSGPSAIYTFLYRV